MKTDLRIPSGFVTVAVVVDVIKLAMSAIALILSWELLAKPTIAKYGWWVFVLLLVAITLLLAIINIALPFHRP